MKIKEVLERNPVIPAIKNDMYLEEAKNSSSEIVFVIISNLLNVTDIVAELKKAGKIVFVHVDMIEGLSSSAYGVEYIIKNIMLSFNLCKNDLFSTDIFIIPFLSLIIYFK